VTGCGGGLVSVEYRLEGREAQGFHGDRTAAAHTSGSSCKTWGVMLASPYDPVLIVYSALTKPSRAPQATRGTKYQRAKYSEKFSPLSTVLVWSRYQKKNIA